MKKLFYIVLAVVAISACTKTEANLTVSNEIELSPVSKYDTRAAIEGTTYSSDYPFYVYANAKSDGQSTFNSKYFEKVLFVKDGENKNGELQVYKGETPQYWPNVNPLVFAGFTKTGNMAEIASNTITTEETLTYLIIPGYIQPSPTEGHPNDLMYFFADNQDAGYTKNTNYVDPVMKHACSWITINIKADSKLIEDRDNNTEGVQAFWEDLEVVNIHFEKLHKEGSVKLSENIAPIWDLSSQISTENVRTAEMPITGAYQEFADINNNTIVLPQTPTYLSVTYRYTTPAGTQNFTETKRLPLNYNGEVRADGETEAQYRERWTKWEPGKHYTYNLTLTAEEIKIAPSSTDWTADPTNIEF